MANPVTVAELEARWRPLTPAEAEVAQALLDDAWAILTLRLPTLEQRMDAQEVSTGAVIAVVSAMVLRVMRNPDGKISESIDDYTYRRADAVSDGALFVSSAEL
ncbi:MAG TPA: Gp19/Gp15/Gp42 family protein, partial [Thermomicrobiales bacterium]|nr:Gp19/Gp15/Gp42 family protein [Thermomicrobiales bacterium]